MVVAASFFASSFPDGLDYLAGKLGFLQKGVSRSAFMKDYSVSFLGAGALSTASSGIIGITVIWCVFALLRAILNFSRTERKGDK